LDRSLQYLSFVQLALTLGEAGRKCDAQVLIKKSVKAPFFPIRISGEYSHKNGMRVFVTNKISIERKQSQYARLRPLLSIMNFTSIKRELADFSASIP
jgi:hypothetical protein